MRNLIWLFFIVILFLGAKKSEHTVTYTASIDPMFIPVVKPPTPDLKDVELLASVIFCEAAHEPLEGKVGIGNVVTYRMKVKQQSMRTVVFAKGQFDGVSNRYFKRLGHYKVKYADKWKEAMRASYLALVGRKVVPEGVYYYHNKKAATDRIWVRYLSKYEYATIGQHTFCYNPKFNKT